MATDRPGSPTVATEDNVCVVCWERPRGAPLRPCGHSHFCAQCTRHFRSCPLCRAPLTHLVHDSSEDADTDHGPGSPRQPTFINKSEAWSVVAVGLFVFSFLVIAGYIEWRHDIPEGCSLAGTSGPNASAIDAEVCHTCVKKNAWAGNRCSRCQNGYINGGLLCYEHVDDLPPVKTGAALGGSFYFALIITTQVCGMLSEIFLIRRMRLRNLMPGKELFVLLTALCIEVLRMLLVDIFILQEYFGGRSYAIFRVPISCNVTAAGAWLGADGQWHCPDPSPYSASTLYYIADYTTSFSVDSNQCSTFTTSSALLDYSVNSGSWPFHAGGHPRFTRLGWVVGGEFALYYFFATFINEVADNMFIVPTVASFGWFCKLFSVALELFQLGALCPAAIFTHGDCLHYTDPLGVSLNLTREIITMFGYCIWGFGFMMGPLGAIGLVIVGSLAITNRFVLKCMVCPVRMCCGHQAAHNLDQTRLRLDTKLNHAWSFFLSSKTTFLVAVMLLAFVPLLLSGMILGALVVVGQASKKGTMQVLTAIVLLSDVLFKIVATAVTETVDYMLHVRVRNAVANATRSRPHGNAIGNSMVVSDVTE